jgi:hypothetical protein
VSQTIGLDGQKIVPSEEELEAMQQQQLAMAAEQAAMGNPDEENPSQDKSAARAQGGQKRPGATKDMGPRTNLQQKQPRVAGGVQ